jgi:hypothetical protein
MAEASKVCNQAKVGALIKQEFHLGGGSVGSPWGALETPLRRSPMPLRKRGKPAHLGQVRMSRQKLVDVRIVGKFFGHQAHGNLCSPHHRLSPKDPWIRSNAVFLVRSVSFFHGRAPDITGSRR